MSLNLNSSSRRELLKKLEEAGLDFQLAIALMEMPEIARQMVRETRQRLIGKHRFFKAEKAPEADTLGQTQKLLL